MRKKITVRKTRKDGVRQRYHLKGTTIDYSKDMKYGGKEWEQLKSLQEANKGNITSWRAATGEAYEVKRKRLYYGGEPVYKWQGWGMGAGTHYEIGKGRYKKSFYLDNILGYLKTYMKPFIIPINPSRKR